MPYTPEQRERRLAHKRTPKYRAKARANYAKNREHRRAYSNAWAIKAAYGITQEQVDEMAAVQNHRCAICNEPPRGKGHCGKLHVDHCHETGKVRGLLCIRCNCALGQARHDCEILVKMIAYLEAA